MRIWSLHPAHLDRIGLVAGWREGLLAQAALARPEGGYGRHPQLERFRMSPDPLAALGTYLEHLADEADERGYRFDRSRVAVRRSGDPSVIHAQLVVINGQLALEREHLLAKLDRRSPSDAARLRADPLRAHPSFVVVPGVVAAWERAEPRPAQAPPQR